MRNKIEVNFGEARLPELLTEVAEWLKHTDKILEVDSVSLVKLKGEFWSCKVFYYYLSL